MHTPALTFSSTSNNVPITTVCHASYYQPVATKPPPSSMYERLLFECWLRQANYRKRQSSTYENLFIVVVQAQCHQHMTALLFTWLDWLIWLSLTLTPTSFCCSAGIRVSLWLKQFIQFLALYVRHLNPQEFPLQPTYVFIQYTYICIYTPTYVCTYASA